MAKKKTINIQGLIIRVDNIQDNDFINLTDIAKQSKDEAPRFVIRNWMTSQQTLRYLAAWEQIHNLDFKRAEFRTFKMDFFDKPFSITPEKWIKAVNAIGLISKRGKYGGTFAHKDIAIQFCFWLSPEFQVLLVKEFQRLKEEESQRQNMQWHLSKITDNIDEVRNLLDTFPGQNPSRNRLNTPKDE